MQMNLGAANNKEALMRQPLLILPVLGGLAALSGCSATETAAVIEDPGAFTCRETAAARNNVSFDETSADLINVDISERKHYVVSVKGKQIKCSVDDEGSLYEFTTM